MTLKTRMRTRFRWIAIVIIIIPFLIFLAFAGAMIFIDFNKYKVQIEAEVKQFTGHTLEIKGDLDVKIIPFSLTMQEVALKNRPDFDDLNIATLKSASIQISLWDLFINQNITVTGLELNQPKLFLNRLPSGKTNWQAFENLTQNLAFIPSLQSVAGFKKVAYQTVNVSNVPEIIQETPQKIVTTVKSGWLLGRLSVNGGEITWHDQQAGRHITLKNIELLAFDLRADEAFNLALKLDYDNLKNLQPLAFNLSTDLAVSNDFSAWLFSDWQGDAMLTLPESHYAEQIQIDLEGQGLSLDLKTQSIGIKQAQFKALEAQALLNGQGQFGQEFSLDGEVDARNFYFPSWQKYLNTAGFQFADSSALNRVAIALQFSLYNTGFALNEIVLRVDDTTLTGNAWKKSLEQPKYYFNFAIDHLNLDRYAIKIKQAVTKTYLPLALPIRTLRALNAEGQIKISQLQVRQLKFSDFDTTISAHSGEIYFSPLDVKLYQGNLQSKLKLDVTQDTPIYEWKGKVEEVQLAPFLQDGWQQNTFSGSYSGFFNLKTKGVNDYLLRQNMNGSFSAKVSQGAVTGMDLNRLLAGKKSNLKDQTQFKLLEVDGKLQDGVYHISKMNILSERFSGIGVGSIYLTNAWIDVRVDTLVKQPPSGLDGLTGLQVPVNIKGPIAHPQWSVDTQRMLNNPSNQSKFFKELGNLLGLTQ